MRMYIQNSSKILHFGTLFGVASLTGCAIGLNITVLDTSVEEDKGPTSIDPNDPSGGQTSGGQTSGGQTSGGQTSSGQTGGGQTSSGQTSGGQTSGGQTGYDTGLPNDTGNPVPAGLLQSISPRFGSTSGNTLITITGGPLMKEPRCILVRSKLQSLCIYSNYTTSIKSNS